MKSTTMIGIKIVFHLHKRVTRTAEKSAVHINNSAKNIQSRPRGEDESS